MWGADGAGEGLWGQKLGHCPSVEGEAQAGNEEFEGGLGRYRQAVEEELDSQEAKGDQGDDYQGTRTWNWEDPEELKR